MKWGKSSDKAADKLTEKITELFGAKGLYVLLTLTTLALLIGATSKWG